MRKNKLLLLLALLLTAATGAWAQGGGDAAKYTKAVAISELKVGDILAQGASITGESSDAVKLDPNRSKVGNDVVGTEVGLNLTVSFGTNGTINNQYAPVTESGQDGDAWVVTNVKNQFGIYTVNLAGILMTGGTEPVATTYTVSLKDNVKDADKWTVKVGDGLAQALPIGGLTGDGSETVTLQYNGRLKVKGVKATSEAAAEEPAVTWNTVDLSTLTADYEAQDGDKLTGTLPGNYKISIADGATVMLDGAVINGTSNWSYEWAGLTLAGDGTIILSGENSVKGFYEDYPGISVPANKTLTIQGDGSLTASSNGYGAGIGGGWSIACGNITIEGGTVTATGSHRSAGIGGGRGSSCGNISITGGTVTATGGGMAPGIGGGYSTSCGNISITGGTVTATGGDYAVGIGGGYSTSCGNITIANTVTKVTATKGDNAAHSIGKGYGTGSSCGTVTIGGTKYWENNAAVGDGDTYLATSPLTYDPSN